MDTVQDLQDELATLQRAFDALWDEHKGCTGVSTPEVTLEYKTLEPKWEFASGLDTTLISGQHRTEVTVTIIQDGTKWTLTTDRWTMEKQSGL